MTINTQVITDALNILMEKARKEERERIIALIEAKDEWHYAFSDVSDIIALIKGEKE